MHAHVHSASDAHAQYSLV